MADVPRGGRGARYAAFDFDAIHAVQQGAIPALRNIFLWHAPPTQQLLAAPFALVSAPSFEPKTAKDLVALVKANPDKYTFASSGTGATAHLFSEMLIAATGMKAQIGRAHV